MGCPQIPIWRLRLYKRSVITDEISQDLDRAIAVAREYNLEGIDVRSVWDKTIHQLDDDELARLRRAADAAGLAISSVAPPFLKCKPEELDEHVRILEQTIRAADALGARVIRGFTFWKGTASWEQIVDAYRRAAPIVERAGMLVAIENEHACELGTTEQLPRLIDEVGSDAVRVIWDPGNGAHDGEVAYPDAFERILPLTAHVHLKDGHYVDGKWQWCVLGEGTVGVSRVLDALAERYDGWVALETHYRPVPTGADLTRPGGEAFTHRGEEGTRQCLEAWDRLMKAGRRG